MRNPGERLLTETELPARLKDLPRPPEHLYVRGALPGGPSVAIVGTRFPTKEAKVFARELASELAQRGASILSGGARGIDTQAHEGALDVGGHTVVVAPSGFDRPFPVENAGLYHRVIERGGAYVSLVPADTPASTAGFFPRNACLVALAHVLVVVEAPLRSGARNAAAQARKIGRPIFVVPAPPWNTRGNGAIAELKLGARPLGSARDVLEWFAERRLWSVPVMAGDKMEGSAGGELLEGASTERSGVPARERLLAVLREGSAFPDHLSARARIEPAELRLLVLTLTLEGVVVSDPSGFVRISAT